MNSVRVFVRLWLAITFAIVTYAFVDLALHPELRQERPVSLRPDLGQIGELVHWGGRLLKEDAYVLLFGNALLLAGLLTLAFNSVIRAIRRRSAATARVSIYPAESTPSIHPPSPCA